MRTLKSLNSQNRMPEQGGTGMASVPEQGGTGVRSMPEQGGTGVLLASVLALGAMLSGPAAALDSAGIWMTEGELSTNIQYGIDSAGQLKLSFSLAHPEDGTRLFVATGPVRKDVTELDVWRVESVKKAELVHAGTMSVVVGTCNGIAELVLSKSESGGTDDKSESGGTGDKRSAFSFSALDGDCLLKSESGGTG
ncbi:MAG TPA: hypothetical protein PKZ76_02070 [Xanthomonadaceae bacterium]|nr:hypothetical protein [Xanthomonadaceae bacterium]